MSAVGSQAVLTTIFALSAHKHKADVEQIDVYGSLVPKAVIVRNTFGGYTTESIVLLAHTCTI